ncbi:HEAT repeat domain-containing protein [Paenibacillus pinihumi]|uniref:HEAT repeat domain-containing protein n=1 Tax=Paenibacillus pinihumi TaxID=669462 RepID=UPI0004037C3E|nr:HEAT repeat domain-containing protein [Paenibacillus pinihumi]
MDTIEIDNEWQETYEQLKAAANRKSSWRDRLDAVEQLGKWNNEQAIELLANRLNYDTVYQVQEAAYRILKQFGEDVQRPSQKKGELIKGVNKILVRVKKSLPAGHSFEEFKEKLKRMRSDIYDIYEGNKGADFEKWLEDIWSSASAR